MARVNISRFAARQGATLTCDKCRREIAKGEQYRHFKVGFRYGRKQIRCMRPECAPRQSELTNSKMSGVYAAIESAEDTLASLRAGDPEPDASSITEAIHTAAEEIEAVADEYREANEASPTGYVFGEDLNERADEISGAASELESWEPTEDEPDYESCENEDHDLDTDDENALDRGDLTACEDCVEIQRSWWEQVLEEADTALSEVSL